MSVNFALSTFLSHRFPQWGACQVRLGVRRDLLLYCGTPSLRDAILKDVDEIADLDIGIQRFIVILPRFADMIIDCVAS